MHTWTKWMVYQPSLKAFFWLGLFMLQSNCPAFAQMLEVTAKVGDVATLPCSYEMPADKSLTFFNVYWQKHVNDYESDLVVKSYTNGKEDLQYLAYVNRTRVDPQNFTLWISSVKVADEGRYRCIVILKDNKEHENVLYLSVVADFSTPIIRVDIPPKACGPAMLTLTCSSYGGYSKSHRPEVFGLLNNETVEWKITSNVSDNETKLLTITSTLQLNVTQEDLFILCSVGYPGSKVSTNYSLRIQQTCPLGNRSASHGVVISSSVILIFVVVTAVLAKFLRCRRKVAVGELSHEQIHELESFKPTLHEEAG